MQFKDENGTIPPTLDTMPTSGYVWATLPFFCEHGDEIVGYAVAIDAPADNMTYVLACDDAPKMEEIGEYPILFKFHHEEVGERYRAAFTNLVGNYFSQPHPLNLEAIAAILATLQDTSIEFIMATRPSVVGNN